MLDYFLKFVYYVLQMILLVWAGYSFVISIFAFIDRKDKESIGNKKHSFALVVSAHNEEAVIANLIHSLNDMDYDKEKFDIFVIADNCTDNTAEEARNAGANVYERFEGNKRGKGYALEWMFEKIFKMGKKYDYIGLFDADNLVEPNFLNVMNERANQGYKVAQGYLDCKNPNDSWVSYSHSLNYWITNNMFQKARYNLGLSAELGGTGFVMATELIKEYGWGATCLTEDLEFTMKLALKGEKVAWAADAKIYDEKPLTLAQSWKQRVRWMQGHADVCTRFFHKLFAKGLQENELFMVDDALYLLQPFTIVITMIVTLATTFAYVATGHNLFLWNVIPSYLVTSIFIFQLVWPLFILAFEKKFNRHTILGYAIFLVFSLTWIPIIIIGIINKDKKVWDHTKHTRALTVKEVV